MELLNESDFRKEIKKSPRAGYLFFGEEDYLKSFAVKTAKEALCPDPAYAFFNEMTIGALDYTPQKLSDALMPMPMMADKKLVTVNGLNLNNFRPGEIDELIDVLGTLPEYDYNVLILSLPADGLNEGFLPKRPSPLLQRLAEHLTPVRFETCTTAKLTVWAQKHFAHNGINASPEFCASMVEYCGHGMMILASEIDKLCCYLPENGKNEPTEADMRLVCTPAAEYDAFAFTNALMEGRQETALAILADYRFRRVDPIMILGDVIRVVCDMISVRAVTAEGAPTGEISSTLKLHEFKVGLYQKNLRRFPEDRLRRALDACVAADASLKLSPQGYSALERLICSMF